MTKHKALKYGDVVIPEPVREDNVAVYARDARGFYLFLGQWTWTGVICSALLAPRFYKYDIHIRVRAPEAWMACQNTVMLIDRGGD